MIVDNFLNMATAQALNATATGVFNLGSTIDLTTVRDIGAGKQLYVVIQVTTDLTGASATVQFQVASDSAATLATSGQSIHAVSGVYTGTALDTTEGVIIPLPPMVVGAPIQYERYLGVQYTVGAATLSAGAVNAFLTDNPGGAVGARAKTFADALTREPNFV